MQTGWVTSRGVKYFLSSNGTLRTGWKKTRDGWCYLDDKTGALTFGWKKIKGKKYHFGTDGLLIP
jgi:glucan-binding YG repeat protein